MGVYSIERNHAKFGAKLLKAAYLNAGVSISVKVSKFGDFWRNSDWPAYYPSAYYPTGSNQIVWRLSARLRMPEIAKFQGIATGLSSALDQYCSQLVTRFGILALSRAASLMQLRLPSNANEAATPSVPCSRLQILTTNLLCLSSLRHGRSVVLET